MKNFLPISFSGEFLFSFLITIFCFEQSIDGIMNAKEYGICKYKLQSKNLFKHVFFRSLKWCNSYARFSRLEN